MPTAKQRKDKKLKKLGISDKNIKLSRSPKTKRVIDKLKKRK